jgi:hypothetical protein
MTREELKIKLQTTIEKEFRATNAEIAEAFPKNETNVRGIITTEFETLTPWARALGWDVKSDNSQIDQTLLTMPDILFYR